MSFVAWRPLALGLGVALGFFAGLEGVLRLTVGPPPPAVPVFAALSEHERYLAADGDFLTPVYSLPAMPAFPRAATGRRFAVLGGSSVHGGTVTLSYDREFPHRAGRMVGAEVLNLGSPGLDSHDHIRILEELSSVELDALVVYAGHNDFGNAHFESRYGTVSSAVVARARSVLGRLQIYTQLARLVTPVSGARRRTRERMLPGGGEMHLLDESRREMALAGFRANLERIAWTTKQRGLPLVLVTPVSKLTAPSVDAPCDDPQTCPQAQIDRAKALADTEPRRAVAILERVRDSDPMALQAPTAAVEAVRAVAARWPHATLVDAEAGLPRDRSFDVPSGRLFIDAVHLSPQGHNQMASLLAIGLEPVLGVRASLPADGERLRDGPYREGKPLNRRR